MPLTGICPVCVNKLEGVEWSKAGRAAPGVSCCHALSWEVWIRQPDRPLLAGRQGHWAQARLRARPGLVGPHRLRATAAHRPMEPAMGLSEEFLIVLAAHVRQPL